MGLRTNFGALLRERGLDSVDLVDRCGLAAETAIRWVTDRNRQVDLDKVEQVCGELGLDMSRAIVVVPDEETVVAANNSDGD